MTSRTRRGTALAVLAAFLPLALWVPAHADPDRLRLSLSETGPFTEALPTPLFSGSYVPGTATSTFFVRNDSPSTTRATIALAPRGGDTTFEQALSFSASIGGATDAVPLYEERRSNRCRTVVTGPTIAPGGVQQIDVTMAIDPELPQPPAPEHASFAFVVTLSQVTTQGKVDACGSRSPDDESVRVRGANASATSTSPEGPVVGGEVRSLGLVAWLAAGLLGTGALLLLGRRRSDDCG